VHEWRRHNRQDVGFFVLDARGNPVGRTPVHLPQIAQRLLVETSTVKSHVHHIFTKLDVSTRAELAGMATRRG